MYCGICETGINKEREFYANIAYSMIDKYQTKSVLHLNICKDCIDDFENQLITLKEMKQRM